MSESRGGWLSRLSLPVLALQWIGNLLIFLFASAWLQIPDSHVWQFVFSMATACLLVVAFCWLQTATFTRIRRNSTRGELWMRMLAFAVVVLLWFVVAQWICSGSDHLGMYAAYFNSRMSPSLRIVFSPARILAAMNSLITIAEWILVGLLLPVLLEVCTLGPRLAARVHIVRPYRKVLYWLAVFVACLGATAITSALIAWIPETGVSGQIFSVVVRLGIAYTIDVVLWCVLLALTAAWMENEAEPTEPVSP